MNPLQRALIEKIGHDNGFEHVLAHEAEAVAVASARHRTRAVVRMLTAGDFGILFQSTSRALLPELQRSFEPAAAHLNGFVAATEAGLAMLLRRASSLSQALPSQAAQDYQTAVAAALAQLPPGIGGTEVERLVRQRVGQAKFRDAMLDYWGGACSVTGLAVPAVLRASHAKPWTHCTSDEERLDVFNGFLLTANLDALFDRFLISFDDAGGLLISPDITFADRKALCLDQTVHLRWISPEHLMYLRYHREQFASEH
jgi:putative restriction endonuclease